MLHFKETIAGKAVFCQVAHDSVSWWDRSGWKCAQRELNGRYWWHSLQKWLQSVERLVGFHYFPRVAVVRHCACFNHLNWYLMAAFLTVTGGAETFFKLDKKVLKHLLNQCRFLDVV